MRLVLLGTLLLLALLPGTALAADPPPGSTWTEDTIEREDGPSLHVDILRPEGLAEDVRTPVILTVSPYTNHSGQVTPDGSIEGGPSPRFNDLLAAGRVFEKGYTYVIVDLRGFGGSDGCNDWGGPGEQDDVHDAVEWVASQSWSTGKVGMYGKSYDAWTGLMAIAQQPEGLAAVVSQEPVVDGYRYLYMNRLRFSNSVLTPTLFSAIDATPGAPLDSPQYQVNGAQKDPACYLNNISEQQAENPADPFWLPRNLLPTAKGKTTPLFMTQGYLEDNTRPDGVFEYFNNLAGPKRAWFGQFDHVRGTDRDGEGVPLMGREGFAEETMRFFDHYVAGKPLSEAPTTSDPNVEVQDNTGRWRAEASWPPADSAARTTTLKPGSYADDAEGNEGTAQGDKGVTGRGVWSFSQPIADEAHLAGSPVLDVEVDAPAGANLVAAVYDVSPENQATLVSRGARKLDGAGRTSIELYGNDWRFAPGHRIGVLLAPGHDEWWEGRIPSNAEVSITAGSISLPFLANARAKFLDGGPAEKLTDYLDAAPFAVAPETVAEGETPFDLPPAQRTDGVDQGGGPGGGTGSGSGSGSGSGAGAQGGGGEQGGSGGSGAGAGGGGKGAAPSAPGTPATTAARPRLTLSLGADRRRLGRVARRGFRVRARCSVTCDLSGRLTRGGRTVGRFERKTVSGRSVFTVKLTRSAARKLRRARRATLSLRVVATHPDGRQTAATRKLRLKR